MASLCFVVDVDAVVDVVPTAVLLLLAGSGMRVGVLATVRVCLCTDGMLSGSTFMGGSDKGAMEGCEARFPGSVFPLFRLTIVVVVVAAVV